MNTCRKDFAAAALGSEIFALGGHDDDACQLDSVERLDLQTLRWSRGPNMRAERSALGAAVLEGELYALGGVGSEYDKLASVERFVPRAGVWVEGPAMETARSDFAAAVLGDAAR